MRLARRDSFLPFSPPSLGEEEVQAVAAVLRSGWITTGPQVDRFQHEFSRVTGARGAIALNSCTAGLHVALLEMGVGPGDEVITSTMTFAATANVIEHVGARPVLVDVERDTLNLDPSCVAAAITGRTRVIMPVHYAGHPADMDAIGLLAADHGLMILEDAAHALGAAYKGRPIGSSDHPASFSFSATKNLTTAEGGMLTGNSDLLDKCRVRALHGISHTDSPYSWAYEVLAPGFKYNMTDIQAAIGLCQLEKRVTFHRRRAGIAARYQEAFADLPALDRPVERPEVEHAWHLYPVRLHLDALRIDRDQFVGQLTALNIGSSVHFRPLHLHPYYRDTYGYSDGDFPVAFDSYGRLVSLPLHPGLSDADVEDVVTAVRTILHRYTR